MNAEEKTVPIDLNLTTRIVATEFITTEIVATILASLPPDAASVLAASMRDAAARRFSGEPIDGDDDEEREAVGELDAMKRAYAGHIVNAAELRAEQLRVVGAVIAGLAAMQPQGKGN